MTQQARTGARWILVPATTMLIANVVTAFVAGLLFLLHPAGAIRTGLEAAVACSSVTALAALAVYVSQYRRMAISSAMTRRVLTVLEQVDDGITWELDPTGVISYISPLVTEFTGYRPSDLIGVHFQEVLPEFERLRAERLLEHAALTGQGWTDEHFTYITAAGNELPLLSSGVAHVGARGVVLGFTGALHAADNPPPRRDRSQVKSRIEAVLRDEAVQMVFQPIMDIAGSRTVMMEALARFQAEPAQPPDVWFADAARVGLGVDLELLAIRRALADARSLCPDVALSINASPATLTSGRMLETLQRSELELHRIVVEVTEHAFVSDYEPLMQALLELRDARVRIAVDDAGAGYASLTHVLMMRPDFIKLDRALVAGIESDPGRRALLAGLRDYAHEIGAGVVAEGIETPAELATLAELGLDFGQGYLLGRPAPFVAPAGPGLERGTGTPVLR